MNLRMLLVAAMMTSVALAGCLSSTDGDQPLEDGAPPGDLRDPYQAIADLLDGVPCALNAPAGLEPTENLLHLDNLTIDEGLHAELDSAGDYLLWARYGAGGFEILDVSDPLDPVLVGQFLNSSGALDVKASPDNTTAFVGAGNGVDIVDIRDPAEPVKTGEWDFPDALPHETLRNPHMLYTATVADQDWLFIAPNSNSGIYILRIQGEPGSISLNMVARTAPVWGGVIGPHDLWVDESDPITGTPTLYSADGFEGWSSWDISDPTSPTLIARVLPTEGAYHGYTHTIQSTQIGDRRIVTTIAEVGYNALKVYDATIPEAPILLGTWQADPAGDPAAPQHNLNIVGDFLFVAHYQKGFYVFDLTEMPDVPLTGFAQIEPMAHWTRNTGDAANQGPTGFNGVWDVVVRDGVLFASDVVDLRTVGFGCFEPGDERLFSVG